MHLLIPYIQKASHIDPVFREFTYGDIGPRGRQLKTLRPGSYVFFHTGKHGKKYITAFYVVDRVLETKVAAGDKLISEKYKNPHIREYLSGDRNYPNDFVLFGDPILSRVFEEPLLFDRSLACELSLHIKFAANRSETQIIGSATRQWRKLTDKDVKLLFEKAKKQTTGQRAQMLRSSEEVAETLERDIERLIIQNPNLIASELKLRENQGRTDDGRLDVLFVDSGGDLILVEIKLGRIGRDAIRQTKNYMRFLRETENRRVSGVIVCAGVMPAYEEELRKQKDVRILIHGWNLQIREW